MAKVIVKRWLVVTQRDELGPYADKKDAECVARARLWAHVVELTGEYDDSDDASGY